MTAVETVPDLVDRHRFFDALAPGVSLWRPTAFTAEEKRRDFGYYEPLTVRDSSLSACTQAIVAAEVGHLDLAYDYFGEAVRTYPERFVGTVKVKEPEAFTDAQIACGSTRMVLAGSTI